MEAYEDQLWWDLREEANKIQKRRHCVFQKMVALKNAK
jgi:hypothetical protein